MPLLFNTSGLDPTVLYFFQCKNYYFQWIIWLVGSLLCFAVGFPASVALLWEIFKTHRGRTPFTPNDFFLLNLTVMDAVFMAFTPPGLINFFLFYSIEFEAVWNFVYALNLCGRPLMMACVCLDSYLAVVHPLTYRKWKTLTPRVGMAAVVWTVTLAYGFLYVFIKFLFMTFFSCVPYLVAIVIIGACDSVIIYTLIKSDPSKKTIHPQKKRAIQTLTNSLVMALISYLPPLLLYLFGIPLLSRNTIMCTISIPVTLTTSSGSAVMPLLSLNNLGKLDRFKFGCCKKT